VPNLRFGSFNEEWSSISLDKIVDVNPKTDVPKNFKYISLESVVNGVLLSTTDEHKDTAPSRAQRKLEINDVLYQTVRPYQLNNFIFNINDSNSYVASTGYAQLRAKGKNYYKFVYNKLHTNNFTNSVLVRCTGTSYPAINSTVLSKIKVFAPKSQEQEKIGNSLSILDRKIELLEHKLEALKLFKKGLSNKLVLEHCNSQNLVRIKSFADVVTGTTPSTKDHEFYNGDIVWITPTDIDDNMYINKSKKLLTEKGLAKGRIIPKYSLLVTCIASIGKNAIISVDGSCNQQINAVLPSKSHESEYLYHYFNVHYNLLDSLAGAGGMKMLSKSDFENVKIHLPSIKIQKRISDVLRNYENKIELMNQQLETLKQFKKGLLQQMFV